MPDLTLVEEDRRSYWTLLVHLWRKFNLVLVVADGVKALDGAIVSSRLFVGRQYCVVHLKRSMSRVEREELDEILFLG